MKTLSLSEYLADPCPEPSLSSGAAWSIITRSPRHAFEAHPKLNPNYAFDVTPAMDIGAAAHALFLEGDKSRFEIISADDWRKKATQKQRDEARDAGRIPLLVKDHDRVAAMISAVLYAVRACDEIAFVLDSRNHVEQSCIWQEGETWCRARPDLVSADYTVNVQYKTTETSASPESFGAGLLVKGGYHVQAYHQARGIKATCKTDELPKTIWIVQELQPPYAVSILGMSPSLQELADSQWSYALKTWRKCLASGDWPAYPNRVCWIEARAWDIERWTTRPDVVEAAQPDKPCPHGLSNPSVCRKCREET